MTTIPLLSSISVTPDIKQGDSLIPPNENQDHIPTAKATKGTRSEDRIIFLGTCFKAV